jgi:hypothetical protein
MMFNHYPTEMETNKLLSNFMEQNPLSEADSHSGSQKISRLLWNQNVNFLFTLLRNKYYSFSHSQALIVQDGPLAFLLGVS